MGAVRAGGSGPGRAARPLGAAILPTHDRPADREEGLAVSGPTTFDSGQLPGQAGLLGSPRQEVKELAPERLVAIPPAPNPPIPLFLSQPHPRISGIIPVPGGDFFISL